jgi:hypothetical protein
MSTRRLRRIATGCGLAIAATSLVSCSANAAHHTTTSAPSQASTAVATRWWSNSAVDSGSTIDASRPDSAAANLQPSRTDYCGMLEQTIASGKSPLSGMAASDPALRNTMTAFIGELEKVAPAEVSADWQVVGTAVLGLVNAGGKAPKTAAVDGTAVQNATAAIAADAESGCGVDLSPEVP